MFLVCGEALFDIFADGSIAKNATHLPFDGVAGGSPFNVAIGLSRIGQDSALLTGVSEDFLGQRLMAILEQEQVNTDFIVSKNAPTTLSFIQKDSAGVPDYAFYGTGGADRSVTIDDLPDDCTIDGIHVGSYSIVTPPTADTLLHLIQKHSGKGLISLDPNVRLGVEPDIKQWISRVDQIAHHANLLKISDEDFEHLYPKTPVEDKVKEWLSFGVGLVAFTKGGDGADLWSQQAKATVQTPKISVADTVGAGDTFQTALIDQLLTLKSQSDDWEDLLDTKQLTAIGKFAATAAAITCTRQGADLPTKAEINEALS